MREDTLLALSLVATHCAAARPRLALRACTARELTRALAHYPDDHVLARAADLRRAGEAWRAWRTASAHRRPRRNSWARLRGRNDETPIVLL